MAIAISGAFHSYTFPRWDAWLAAGLAAAEASGQRNSARRLERSLGEYHRQRGDVAQAEGLLRASLAAAQGLLETATTDDETEAGHRGMAVTQSSLASLLRTRGQYEEAERLYRSGLAICRAIRDPQGVAVFQMGLGQLALAQSRPDEGLPLLQQARQGFVALGLGHWVAQVDELLAVAQGRVLTLADLLALVRAACQGDQQAGQQAWEICEALAQGQDEALSALGSGLRRVLAGDPPTEALADLPDELRARLVQGLQN